ncbi:gamma-glutamyltransferase 2 [Microbacterium sp. SLBN-154]|nr:gamma-glutamyltransferase 2 [Microbacterium sp. SLBN-154]
MLRSGGSAVDAAIAAQAVICVVLPDAAGLGGDLLALVSRPGQVTAVNGVGRSPAQAPARWSSDGGGSVTVPGLVDGWLTLHRHGGRLPLVDILSPARRLAEQTPLPVGTAEAAQRHRPRLERFGGAGWALLDALTTGVETWSQPELADLLDAIGTRGRDAFYAGDAADAIVAAVHRAGGSLTISDLAAHRSMASEPVSVRWHGGQLLVQPPPSQAVLLAMAAAWLEREGAPENLDALPHLLVELTESAFTHRSDAGRGKDLLSMALDVDPDRASGRGGPRSYLHTAGVATADAEGMVVSSLVSVFDDFGSGVYVPELGIVLANRAAGFTDGANAAGPGRYPVHTLAPALLVEDDAVTALATPGADGQVQTLLQLLARHRYLDEDWPSAVIAPRWRSEDGRLLVEHGHPAELDLRERGHEVVTRDYGEDVFGAVVIAGVDSGGPFAIADSRRSVEAGAA